jgi:hypothetical protein
VQEILAVGVDKHLRARIELEELAMRSLEYQTPGADLSTWTEVCLSGVWAEVLRELSI